MLDQNSALVITKVSSSPSNVTLECIIIVMKKCQIFGELTKNNKLRTILENTDWLEIYGIQDVEQAWNMFIDILGNAITECVPMRDRRPANNSKRK